MATTWNYLTQSVTKTQRSWTNVEKATFHYLNPHGLVNKKFANNRIISKMVDDGKCKSGAIIAHGTLDFFATDCMINLTKKKRVSPSDLSSAIYMLEFAIKLQEKFIAEHQ